MEEVVQDTPVDVRPKISRSKLLRNGGILLIAAALGGLHAWYVAQLHENYFHFSHLSDLERELTLRTEMGFYYSYYKTIVEERPFLAAISKLMHDRSVEYPKEVNAFNRFNIHPEVLIGALYRYLSPQWRTCHVVERAGAGAAGAGAVDSCVGAGVPVYFYLGALWALAGLLLAFIFLHGVTLSGSVLGGLLSAAQYLANHAQATRVQRAPNQRENLAVPLLCAQAWLLTLQLRARRGTHCFRLQVCLLAVNCLCLLCWQLSQFVLLSQAFILFALEQARVIDLRSLAVLLHAHFCGLHVAVLLLHGNDMLKSSLYTSFFLVVSSYCMFFSSFRIKVRTMCDFVVESWLVVLRICIVICASIYLKKVISDFLGAEDDNHIWELLLSKFTDHKSFHTLMYTCIDAFDFLPMSYFVDTTKTLLLPLAIYGLLHHCLQWVSEASQATKEHFSNKKKTKKDEQTESNSKLRKPEQKPKEESNSKPHQSVDKTKEEEKRAEDKDSDSDDSGIENNAENVTKKIFERIDLDDLDKEAKYKCVKENVDLKEAKDNLEAETNTVDSAKLDKEAKDKREAETVDPKETKVKSEKETETLGSAELDREDKHNRDIDTETVDPAELYKEAKDKHGKERNTVDPAKLDKEAKHNREKEIEIVHLDKEARHNRDVYIVTVNPTELDRAAKVNRDVETKTIDPAGLDKEVKLNREVERENAKIKREKKTETLNSAKLDREAKVNRDVESETVDPAKLDKEAKHNHEVETENAKAKREKETEEAKHNRKAETEPVAELSTESVLLYWMRHVRADPALAAAGAQLAALCAGALLFARLRVLLTPQLCVLAALAVNADVPLFRPRVSKLVLWSAAAALIAQQLVGNVTRQLAFKGEFSDPWTEELVHWLSHETPPRAAVAASLPAAAAVLLAARRPVVAHPHYEHKDARERAYAVHKVYGRFSEQHVYEELRRLRASYLIVETRLCYGRTTQGCTLLSVWDADQPQRAARPQLCRQVLARGADRLYRVFRNRHYAVFRVHDLSVRYMPRVFDS